VVVHTKTQAVFDVWGGFRRRTAFAQHELPRQAEEIRARGRIFFFSLVQLADYSMRITTAGTRPHDAEQSRSFKCLTAMHN